MTTIRGAGSDLVQRLNTISEVEKSIGNLLRHAQTCISELSKEKQISKTKMEESSQAFKKTLTQVEKELSEQMMYLSHVCVGSAHQGSTFVSQQNIALAEAAVLDLHQELAAITRKHFGDTEI
uniref:Mediator of RNA polymerase II transcription subunit 11 n=1 Tax=Angiostrongylus cantonensis TaxID=6313 RepID=A0A0K0D9H3_ANGCA